MSTWYGEVYEVASRTLLASEQPSKVRLSKDFYQLLDLIGDRSQKYKQEFGSYIIRDSDGEIKLKGLVRGERGEVKFKEPIELSKGQEIIGIFHTHLQSSEPSEHDIKSFKSNLWEKVMLIKSSDSTSLLVKEFDEYGSDYSYYSGDDRTLKLRDGYIHRGESVTLEALLLDVSGTKVVPEGVKKFEEDLKNGEKSVDAV